MYRIHTLLKTYWWVTKITNMTICQYRLLTVNAAGAWFPEANNNLFEWHAWIIVPIFSFRANSISRYHVIDIITRSCVMRNYGLNSERSGILTFPSSAFMGLSWRQQGHPWWCNECERYGIRSTRKMATNTHARRLEKWLLARWNYAKLRAHQAEGIPDIDMFVVFMWLTLMSLKEGIYPVNWSDFVNIVEIQLKINEIKVGTRVFQTFPNIKRSSLKFLNYIYLVWTCLDLNQRL